MAATTAKTTAASALSATTASATGWSSWQYCTVVSAAVRKTKLTASRDYTATVPLVRGVFVIGFDKSIYVKKAIKRNTAYNVRISARC